MDLSKVLFTESHEWVYMDGDTAIVGITDFAQKELGDLVFVELPEAGQEVAKEENFGSIESVKAVSDLLAPVSGEVVEINAEVQDKAEIINEDPYEKGWLLKIKISDKSELDDLMDQAAYNAFLESQD